MSSGKTDLSNVQKVCLIVIDGWGLSDEKEGNAIYHAKTPVMDSLMKCHIPLHASESYVGSLEGVMGSSKVGHINIGAGRLVWQDMAVFKKFKKTGEFKKQPGMLKAIEHAKKSGRLQLLGLVSDGGIHSHIDHLMDYILLAQELGVKECYVHFFADGRDAKPKSACQYIKQLTNFMDQQKYGKISTLMGRATAMDRDNNWKETNRAYSCLLTGGGEEECPPEKLIERVTQLQIDISMDEELKPLVIDKEGLIKDGDSLLFFNFRADRMVQLVSLFCGLKEAPEGTKTLKDLNMFSTTCYDPKFTFEYLLPIVPRTNSLSEFLSSKGIKHYHCAETEKYYHVTKFFNEPHDKPHEGEVWEMVPSLGTPYVGKPRMSVDAICDKMVAAILSGQYHFCVCNLANPDMIGHTGGFEDTVIACEATDEVIGKILDACKKMDFILMVTSDHGNAEKMIEDGEPCPKHTFNKVPLCISKKFEFASPHAQDEFSLKDIAPTVLKIMKLPIPQEMTGTPLVK